ncbi:MAG: hypothetical protein ACI4HI_09130 [Lachnospiraceae bacterium]
MSRKTYRICLMVLLVATVIALIVYYGQIPKQQTYDKNSVLVQMEGGQRCRKLYI